MSDRYFGDYGSQYRGNRVTSGASNYGKTDIVLGVASMLAGEFSDWRRRKDEEKKEREAEDKKLQLELKKANMATNVAMADIDASMTEQEQKRTERANAAAAASAEAKRKTELESLSRKLLQRYALSGDAQDAALLASVGVPSSTLNAVRPKEEKEEIDDEEKSYKTTKGRLRAQKEMGVLKGGDPDEPGNEQRMTPMQMRMRAQGALQAATARALEAYPNASATTVIRQVVDDPSNADVVGDPAFARELRAQAERILNDARAQKARANGGTKQGIGARAAQLRTPPRK